MYRRPRKGVRSDGGEEFDRGGEVLANEGHRMAQIDDVDEIGVALAVIGVFQRVIFRLQGESEIGRQSDLHRQGDAAFDDAIAEAWRGGGTLT